MCVGVSCIDSSRKCQAPELLLLLFELFNTLNDELRSLVYPNQGLMMTPLTEIGVDLMRDHLECDRRRLGV